jgi:hypothetical protein
MNWKRGLFRFWVLGSCLWIGLGLWFNKDELFSPSMVSIKFSNSEFWYYPHHYGVEKISAEVERRLAQINADIRKRVADLEPSVRQTCEALPITTPFDHMTQTCAEVMLFRLNFERNVHDGWQNSVDLEKDFYVRIEIISYLVGLPVAIFLVGAGFAWVAAGFRSKKL